MTSSDAAATPPGELPADATSRSREHPWTELHGYRAADVWQTQQASESEPTVLKRPPTDSHPAPEGARAGLSWRGWLTIGACVAYILSPVDLAPEAILGPLGVPDDILAALIAGKVILSSRRKPRATDGGG